MRETRLDKINSMFSNVYGKGGLVVPRLQLTGRFRGGQRNDMLAAHTLSRLKFNTDELESLASDVEYDVAGLLEQAGTSLMGMLTSSQFTLRSCIGSTAQAVALDLMLRVNGFLESLRIGYCELGSAPDEEDQDELLLTPERIKPLAETVRCSASLTNLSLNDNQLCGLDQYGGGPYSTEGLAVLLAALQSPGCRVITLCLDGNSIGRGGHPEGVVLLADALKANTSIRTLSLKSNQLCGVDNHGEGEYNTEGLAALMALLRSPDCGIQSLDLTNNFIGQVNHTM